MATAAESAIETATPVPLDVAQLGIESEEALEQLLASCSPEEE